MYKKCVKLKFFTTRVLNTKMFKTLSKMFKNRLKCAKIVKLKCFADSVLNKFQKLNIHCFIHSLPDK